MGKGRLFVDNLCPSKESATQVEFTSLQAARDIRKALPSYGVVYETVNSQPFLGKHLFKCLKFCYQVCLALQSLGWPKHYFPSSVIIRDMLIMPVIGQEQDTGVSRQASEFPAIVSPVCKLIYSAACLLTASVPYLVGLVCGHCCQACLSFEYLYHLVPVCSFFLLKLQVSFSLIRSQVLDFVSLSV